MSHELKTLLALAKKAQIELHSVLSPIQENGHFRMLANADLPPGMIVFRQSAQARLQPSAQVQFPGQVDPGIQLLHRLASEASAPQSASAELLLAATHSPELTRSYNACYLSEADLNTLASLHDILPAAIHLLKNRIGQICQYLLSIDSSLDRSVLENLALNAFRLGWFTSHFTPLTHLFRTCGLRGARIVREGNDFVIRTPRQIRKGEEIFLSLGRQDIFDSVVSAPEFDAGLRYYIAFGLRLPQRIAAPFALKVVEHASQSFPIAFSHQKREKRDAYILQDPNALLMESGPSASLMAFFNAIAFANPRELAKQTPDQKTMKTFVQEVLARLQAMNHVNQNGALIRAPHLQKYVQAAERDHRILALNADWATDAFPA